MFCKNGVLRNFSKFTRQHLCQSLYFNKVAGLACNFIKKETLAQLFSWEFCEISKNNFFDRIPPAAASVLITDIFQLWRIFLIDLLVFFTSLSIFFTSFSISAIQVSTFLQQRDILRMQFSKTDRRDFLQKTPHSSMRTLTLIFIFTEVIILKRKPWIFFVCKNCFEEISEVFHNDVISGLRVNKILLYLRRRNLPKY